MPGRSVSEHLDAWTLDDWSPGRLDAWTLDTCTLRLWMIGLWTLGRLDSGRLDAWTLDTWTLDNWMIGLWKFGLRVRISKDLIVTLIL